MFRTSLRGRCAALTAVSAVALGSSLAVVLTGTGPADAAARTGFTPGDLVVSRLHYVGTPGMIVPGKTVLPTGVTAVADGSFAHVWDNANVDGNFGVTAPIYLDELDAAGNTVSSTEVPVGTPGSSSRGHDVLTGSFSSKSEGALNLSTDGSRLTFMGYAVPPNTIDASNGNTPGVYDPTNPDAQSVYRGIGEVDSQGKFWVTETNAYSGDNGRAAILDDATGTYYAAGNSNNGTGTSVPGLIYGTGAQLVTPAYESEAEQTPGQPTPVGGFSTTELPGVTKADKLGKDTNFAAVAIHDGVVYYTKGSGSNGVDTVYYVDTTGSCHDGTGIPAADATVPSTPDAYDPTTGEPAHNMCILKGFPTALAKSITTPEDGTGAANATAFGALWFANDTTLYVADAGNGEDTHADGSYTDAAAQTLAGIQKWSLVDGTWTYDYTLQTGLGLGRPYAAAGLPSGTNAATGLPWEPAVDGVRNITGKVNAVGTVSLYGVTSAVGGVTDPGADPNKVVAVTDRLGATSEPAGEDYRVLQSAAAGDVYRGTAFAPSN